MSKVCLFHIEFLTFGRQQVSLVTLKAGGSYHEFSLSQELMLILRQPRVLLPTLAVGLRDEFDSPTFLAS